MKKITKKSNGKKLNGKYKKKVRSHKLKAKQFIGGADDKPSSSDDLTPSPGDIDLDSPSDLDFLNDNETAKSGAYNANNSDQPMTGIAKKMQEVQSGLSVQYPGYLNTSQDEALELKLENKREYGFPGLDMKSTALLTPKIDYKSMYEKDTLSSSLVIPKDEFDIETESMKSKQQIAAEQPESESNQ
jgi:hypothetical protein